MTRRNKQKKCKKNVLPTVKDQKEDSVTDDGIGCDDQLSRLPYPCIANVFKHLSRMDIFNMTIVNRSMWPIADDRSLDYIKWRRGLLDIFQTPEGYSFTMDVTKDYEKFKPGVNNYHYFYEVTNGLIERRSVGDNEETLSAEFFPETDEEGRPTRDDFFNQIPYHSSPVPKQFYSVLKERLQHRNARRITIVLIPMTALFFSKLSSLLDGHSVHNLLYIPVKGEEVASVDRKSYLQFLKRFAHVEIMGSNVNEEMIRELADSNVRFLTSKCAYERTLSEFFRPNHSILPYLVGYEKLQVPNLELKAIWIVKLIMLYLDSRPSVKKALFEFNLDERVSSNIISRTIRLPDYKYSRLGSWKYLIVREADNRRAKIEQSKYYVEGRVVYAAKIWISDEENTYGDPQFVYYQEF